MERNFYFCIVKSVVRSKVAENNQRFLWPNFIGNNDTERIKVCGSGNARKVYAQQNLTAPCALFCLTSKKLCV